jgi:methylenetetrahydrofolate dehydrogenase (NAD+)
LSSGFGYTLREVDKDLVEETLIAANADQATDGIIVYYPIFGNRQDQYLQQIVDVSKDVEGLSHRYIFNMYQNIRFLDDAQAQKSVIPCTPLAVIKILEYLRIYNTILPYGNRLFGHTICVVNRSEVVGRPLAALLANDGACVYSVDVSGIQKFTRGEGIRKRKHEVEDMKEWELQDCLPFCDVVVTGVPGEKYKFPCHLLREGAVCVNFSSEKVRWPNIACNIERCWEDFETDLVAEFWTRGEGEGFDICPWHWQGDYCCTLAKSSAHCPKQARR